MTVYGEAFADRRVFQGLALLWTVGRMLPLCDFCALGGLVVVHKDFAAFKGVLSRRNDHVIRVLRRGRVDMLRNELVR